VPLTATLWSCFVRGSFASAGHVMIAASSIAISASS